MNRHFAMALAVLTALALRSVGGQDGLIHQVENKPGNVGVPRLLGDRYEYGADDREAQFYLALPAPVDTNAPPAAAAPAPTNASPLADELYIGLYAVEGSNSSGGLKADVLLPKPLYAKTHFLINIQALAPGRYLVRSVLRDAAHQPLGTPLDWLFSRTTRTRNPAPIPAEGIPLAVEGQDLFPELAQPFHASIPLPMNAVNDIRQLRLEEDGKPVPFQLKPVALWGPEGSVRWAHLQFTGHYKGGAPASYRLRQAPGSAVPSAGPDAVRVQEGADRFTVDNGTVRFTVNRKRFSGIECAWFDPAGQGRYDPANPIVVTNAQMTGPYLVDGRIIRYEASADKDVVVELEERGPVKVTIAASGWYVDPRRNGNGRLCQFKTRITCYAGQPAIRVSHHTIITYDTRTAMLADVGFPVPAGLGQSYRVGMDGAEKTGALPAIPANPEPNREGVTDIPSVYLHQDRSDHVRLVDGATGAEGRRADGWAAVRTTNQSAEVGVVLRDIWQKFPKEIELSRQGLTLHFWPAHGWRAFKLEDELALKNIYKFWCFHQSPLLNLTLPPDYFQALTEAWEETRECRPSHALNGNGEGLAIGNEFEIRFMDADAPAASPLSPGSLAKLAALIQQDPAARTPAAWNARTEALERTAAPDPRFQAVEETFEKGMLAYNASVDRGEDYGMWIWADTHTYWKVGENRASLHRVWQNSHYHQVGNAWQMWFRSDTPELLRWARIFSDHYRNVSTINYTTLDENGRSPLKFHRPGAMYHCKGCTPWGSEAEGMARHDTHAATWGHWTDPDAHLWAWQMDAEPRAKDLYDLWLGSVKRWGILSSGVRREANNTLAMACNAYEATWDADFLPAIHGLGLSLRTAEPLEKQFPGPLWHPLWMNRYYHLTRDPDYIPFILKYARYPSLGDTWTLGLSALAYELSGDATYLTQHMSSLKNLPRTLYQDPGHPYDGYGKGPGPLGFRWGEMAWGPFLKALQEAGIEKVETTNDWIAGVAPMEYGKRARTAVVYALKKTDKPWTIQFRGAGIEGDFVRSTFRAEAPDGTVVAERSIAQAHAPKWEQEIAADGRTGLYRLEVNGYGVFNQNATTLDAHATLLKTNTTYMVPQARGCLAPMGKSSPLEVEVVAAGAGDRLIASVILSDAAGREVGRASLCKEFRRKSASFRLDPAVNPLPWRIDIMGACSIRLSGEAGLWILAPSPADLAAMTAPLAGLMGKSAKP
jgi:hypothetical protein